MDWALWNGSAGFPCCLLQIKCSLTLGTRQVVRIANLKRLSFRLCSSYETKQRMLTYWNWYFVPYRIIRISMLQWNPGSSTLACERKGERACWHSEFKCTRLQCIQFLMNGCNHLPNHCSRIGLIGTGATKKKERGDHLIKFCLFNSPVHSDLSFCIHSRSFASNRKKVFSFKMDPEYSFRISSFFVCLNRWKLWSAKEYRFTFLLRRRGIVLFMFIISRAGAEIVFRPKWPNLISLWSRLLTVHYSIAMFARCYCIDSFGLLIFIVVFLFVLILDLIRFAEEAKNEEYLEQTVDTSLTVLCRMSSNHECIQLIIASLQSNLPSIIAFSEHHSSMTKLHTGLSTLFNRLFQVSLTIVLTFIDWQSYSSCTVDCQSLCHIQRASIIDAKRNKQHGPGKITCQLAGSTIGVHLRAIGAMYFGVVLETRYGHQFVCTRSLCTQLFERWANVPVHLAHDRQSDHRFDYLLWTSLGSTQLQQSAQSQQWYSHGGTTAHEIVVFCQWTPKWTGRGQWQWSWLFTRHALPQQTPNHIGHCQSGRCQFGQTFEAFQVERIVEFWQYEQATSQRGAANRREQFHAVQWMQFEQCHAEEDDFVSIDSVDGNRNLFAVRLVEMKEEEYWK